MENRENRCRGLGLACTFIIAALSLYGCMGGEEYNSGYSSAGEEVSLHSLSMSLVSPKIFHFSWEVIAGVDHYRLLENQTGSDGYIQVGEDIPAESLSFDLTVPLYARTNASYILAACDDADCTNPVESEAIYVANYLDNNLVEAIGYFKASNTGGDDHFGSSVALSADGTTMAVGARSESSAGAGVDVDGEDDSAYGSGAVYVFRKSEGGWEQEAYIKSSNADESDSFGMAISLSDDGSVLAVGAPQEGSLSADIDGDAGDNSGTEVGAAYVFFRDSNDDWMQQAYIKASNAGSFDGFGYSISLSGDGASLAVGAPFEASNAVGINGDQTDDSEFGAGAVYVFRYNGVQWSQEAYVKKCQMLVDVGSLGGLLGSSVALNFVGDTLVIGAISDLEHRGVVTIFRHNGGGWAEEAYLMASNASKDYRFGKSLALSGDGVTLAVGSIGEASAAVGINSNNNGSSALNSGAAYIFRYDGLAWFQDAYIKASNTRENDEFGTSLALSGDGLTLVVGAPHEGSTSTGINGDEYNGSGDTGAVYVYRYDGLSWTQEAYLKASNADSGDSFGASVAINSEGEVIAVGSIGESSNAVGINGDDGDNSVSGSGAVYLY